MTCPIIPLGPGHSRAWWAIYEAVQDSVQGQEAGARAAWAILAALRDRDLLKAKAWKDEPA